jgi:hypothetical protein
MVCKDADMTTADTTNTCTEMVHRPWSITRCPRAAKEDGLCGIHLAAKRKREATQEKWQARNADRDKKLRAAKAACAALAERGIAATPHYDHALGRRSESGHTGKVVVDPEAILAALEARS